MTGVVPVDDPRLAAAVEAAERAGEIQRDRAGSDHDVEYKGRRDLVTDVDLRSETAITDLLDDRFPDHAILAEESGATGDADERWIVDPLDGTTNFLHGHPMYAVSVAVAVRGRPVAGVVACATSGERWWATRDGGAFKGDFAREDGGVRIAVSGIRSLERALIGTGFPFKAPGVVDRYMTQLRCVLEGTAGIRRGGAAALDLCYLAEGRFDGFWELFLNPWDFAAGALIVEEAGGLMATAEGGRPLPLRPGGLVGANSEALLDRLLELLR